MPLQIIGRLKHTRIDLVDATLFPHLPQLGGEGCVVSVNQGAVGEATEKCRLVWGGEGMERNQRK